MKNYILRPLLMLGTVCGLISCRNDMEPEGFPQDEGVTLLLTVDLPSVSTPTSARSARIADDSRVGEIDLLILEKTGGEYRYRYLVKGESIENAAEGKLTFRAKIVGSSVPMRIILVANGSHFIREVDSGDSEQTLRSKILADFSADGLSEVPMSGVIDLPDGVSENRRLSGRLVRSLARAEIINLSPDFVPETVRLYRGNDRIQVLPEEADAARVTFPSVPVTAEASDVTEPSRFNAEGRLEQPVYFPESLAPAETDRRLRATVLVVGGYYKDETRPTYYRMDFVPDDRPETAGQILRNHSYEFRIEKVSGSGWKTPGEAAENDPSNLTAVVVPWEDDTMDMVFDGVHHFGVSSRLVTLPDREGAFETIRVDTDLDTYTLSWTDASGTAEAPVPTITPGGRFDDPSGTFTVAVSADGKRITATLAAGSTAGGSDRAYLLARAGRLELSITLVRAEGTRRNRPVLFYGSTHELGGFGDELFGLTAPNRPQALVQILRNRNNFGPGASSDFSGFAVGGTSSREISWFQAYSFDVIYLTYANNPESTYGVLETYVLDDPNKVLIVQMDNLSTNRTILDRMGIIRSYPLTLTPFYVSEQAPEFLLDGPFGSVEPGTLYRCNDNAFGVMELDHALEKGIIPILMHSAEKVVLGIDPLRKIVYSGDIDLYYDNAGASSGHYPTLGGAVSNPAEILLANLFAWIADQVLTEW